MVVAMEMIAVWLLCGMVAAAVAAAKRRSAPGWLVLGLCFGPLAILAIAVASPDQARSLRAEIQSGKRRRCPQCAEYIRSEARICPLCGAAPLAPPVFDLLGRQRG